MQSSVIGKIEKAHRYAEEKDRVTLSEIAATFRGEHDNYAISYKGDKWHCSCDFFANWGFCSHTLAVQKIMDKMLPSEGITQELVKQV